MKFTVFVFSNAIIRRRPLHFLSVPRTTSSLPVQLLHLKARLSKQNADALIVKSKMGTFLIKALPSMIMAAAADF